VQVSVDEDLSLSDVTSKIGDGMGDIVVGHGENGKLGDGTVLSSDSTGSLVDGGEISVHITRVSSSTWDFFSGGRDFSQGVGVGRHVSENNQHVHFFFVSQVLSSGESKSGSDNSFDGGIVGQVHEEDDTVHGAVDLEVSLEETGSFHVDSHSSEDNSEVVIGMIVDVLLLDEGSLSTNLGTDFVVRKTGSGEKRNLLTSGDGVHDINSGDTSLDHLLRVNSLVGVNGLTLY
jgi:hypothetical protein